MNWKVMMKRDNGSVQRWDVCNMIFGPLKVTLPVALAFVPVFVFGAGRSLVTAVEITTALAILLQFVVALAIGALVLLDLLRSHEQMRTK